MASAARRIGLLAQELPAVTAGRFSTPIAMGGVLLCADGLALISAVCAGHLLWSVITRSIVVPHPSHAIAIAAALGVFALQGLYPGISMTAVEQLRSMVKGLLLVYPAVVATAAMTKAWEVPSRGALAMSCAVSILLAPLGRSIASRAFRSHPSWGIPVIVLGAGRTGALVIRNLRRHGVLGLRPVLCLDDDPEKHGGDCEGVPVVGSLDSVGQFADAYQIRQAVVAMPGMDRADLLLRLQWWSRTFRSILLVPDLFGIATLWIQTRDLGGILGLEIRQNLLHPANRIAKRITDVALAVGGLCVAAPVFAVTAIWIKARAGGPVFFGHVRQGKQGKLIRVWKFRTMHPDAESTLRRYLDENVEAQREWRRYCKLKKDPRVIPGVGAWLRKTSLDELPQLWNVLKGEMSLVGPRPFPTYHNDRFDPEFRALRMRVSPGMTGLWQVSARSDGDLEVQAKLDKYYIQNWSIWLDIYLLARTASVLFSGRGAY